MRTLLMTGDGGQDAIGLAPVAKAKLAQNKMLLTVREAMPTRSVRPATLLTYSGCDQRPLSWYSRCILFPLRWGPMLSSVFISFAFFSFSAFAGQCDIFFQFLGDGREPARDENFADRIRKNHNTGAFKQLDIDAIDFQKSSYGVSTTVSIDRAPQVIRAPFVGAAEVKAKQNAVRELMQNDLRLARALGVLFQSEADKKWRYPLNSGQQVGNMTAPRFAYTNLFYGDYRYKTGVAEKERGYRLAYLDDLSRMSQLLTSAGSERLQRLKSAIDSALTSTEVTGWLQGFKSRDPESAMMTLLGVNDSPLGKQLQLLEEAYGEVSLYYDIADRAARSGWSVFPDVLDPRTTGGPVIKITDGHAPRVLAAAPGKSVPNSIDIGLGKPSNIILTGPNAEGKSTYVRMVAQLLILAESGSPVPASQMSFTPMQVIVYVHPTDSPATGDSLFMAEARALFEKVYKPAQAQPNSLVLMDEIIPGTIAPIREKVESVFLQKLAQTGVASITATHNTGVTSLAGSNPNEFTNLHVDRFNVRPGPADNLDAMYRGAVTALARAGWPQEFLAGLQSSTSQSVVRPIEVHPATMFPGQDLASQISRSAAQVVLIQDTHDQQRIRQKLSEPNFVRELKRQGFTHYLIEAPASSQMDEFLSNYSAGRAALTNAPEVLGPYRSVASGDKSFEAVIEAMHREGIQIVAMDHPSNSAAWPGRLVTREEREQFMADRIRMIVGSSGKPIVLAGKFHLMHTLHGAEPPLGITTTADRLAHQGVRVLSMEIEE